MRADITNVDLGRLLELAPSYVSRIRSNERKPSISILMRIATELDWDLSEQGRAVVDDTYGVEFEKKLVEFYGEDKNATAVEPPA